MALPSLNYLGWRWYHFCSSFINQNQPTWLPPNCKGDWEMWTSTWMFSDNWWAQIATKKHLKHLVSVLSPKINQIRANKKHNIIPLSFCTLTWTYHEEILATILTLYDMRLSQNGEVEFMELRSRRRKRKNIKCWKNIQVLDWNLTDAPLDILIP